MTLGNLRSTNGLANQEGANEPSSDTGLRSSCMSLEERSRTMSSSTSFRDGLEEGEAHCFDQILFIFDCINLEGNSLTFKTL